MTRQQRQIRGLATVLGVSVALALAACGPVKKAGPQLQTLTFTCTNGPQTLVVPGGVTNAGFDLYGAQGGSAGMTPTPGGNGGRAAAGFPVTPGESFQINVGCQGGDGTDTGGTGGFNGGGRGADGNVGSAGGGGASDVRRGGVGFEHRVLVAGGGGGTGEGSGGAPESAGGAGAHPEGVNGSPGDAGGVSPGDGGSGGTQTMGGASACGTCAGSLGTGGQGQAGGGPEDAGGGGGGGLYGGGGGQAGFLASGGGGGGGSSAGPADTTFENGVRGGHGLVTVYFLA